MKAFPQLTNSFNILGGSELTQAQEGMELRDYFAAKVWSSASRPCNRPCERDEEAN